MYNQSALAGRLVETPKLRRTKAGDVSVTSFRIAVRKDYVRDGETDTDFFDVVAWRKTAEFICKYFKKGSMILLHGTLGNRQWTDKFEQNRVTTELTAEKAYFFSNKDKDSTNGELPGDIDPFDDRDFDSGPDDGKSSDFNPFS